MAAQTLRERLADIRATQSSGITPQRTTTVIDLVRSMRDQFAVALPGQLDADRFVRVAMTTLRTNPRLLQCDQQSLLAALMISAQLGLEPGGPLGHAYLVPHGREVTFIVGYRGYIDLARRSGTVRSVYAEVVRKGDEFRWTLGLHRDIQHVPGMKRGELTHVYAVATYRDGLDPDFVVLQRDEIEQYRRRSRAANDGPWVTDFEAMAMKTAVRRLARWMPLNVAMARATVLDEQPISAETALEALGPAADSALEAPDSQSDLPPASFGPEANSPEEERAKANDSAEEEPNGGSLPLG